MTHESSADDESDALSGFGSEVDNFLHNVTDYYRLVPSHQAQVCPIFLLISFALSKKIIDSPGEVKGPSTLSRTADPNHDCVC